MRQKRVTDGFTLLEMLVVVAILGLVASLIVMRGPARSPALEIRAAAGDVAQALRATRVQAIEQGRPVDFLLDATRHQYVTTGARPRALHAPMNVAITAPARGIGFAPDGSSSGGQITVADAGHTAVVSVDWLTGRVRITEPTARTSR